MSVRPFASRFALALVAVGLVAALAAPAAAKERGKKKPPQADPYAEYVWPPPPDKPRIKLEAVLTGRADVEGESKLAKALIGASPKSPWDDLKKPFAVAFDSKGRVLVSDWGTGAVLRFDLEARRFDVLGTQGALPLKQPLGLGVGPDDTLYVADGGRAQVLAFTSEGRLKGQFGRAGDLTNPTDAAVSPDGRQLFVADSKAHRIVVFDIATGSKLRQIGQPGDKADQFGFPTSLAFGPDGDLYVVDQINSRVQVLSADGEFLDHFGALGLAFGNFVRPKDVAVDEVGFIYVTDNAFNNVQIFDSDFTLLTFIGEGGDAPGRFSGASGIAVRGDRFAVVDQIGHRLQIFRFIVPKSAD